MATPAPKFTHDPDKQKLTKGPRSFREKFNALCAATKELQTLLLRDRVIVGRNLAEAQSENGRTVAATAAAGDAAAANLAWQAYPAPYLGGGRPPANQGLNMMIRPGVVWDGVQLWLPARANLVIPVPANCTAGFFVWLDATLNASGVITALDYGYGITVPTAVTLTSDTTGTPPPHAYDMLMVATSTPTGVDFANITQMRTTPLTLMPRVTFETLSILERRMAYSPAPSLNLP